ncbi:39S ribosomal protein L37, mitochondrial [Uranotaenia lowii]|uniref:39S ribosomal protein L37, mitochondrial n=1 Tax=Uranotaenia lowii TaxID=190385 RepID=UPI00247A1304|nr:39S ribosomal protein L37, mitochondrial [Uranotaenia lowii]
MRFTAVLFRQHIGYHFKKHWIIQGKRVPTELGAAAELAARGIPVVEARQVLDGDWKREIISKPVGQLPPETALDENHPLYKQEACYQYSDSNVLLEGVRQAQVLLNTIVYEELPSKYEERIEKLKIPTQLDRSMQQSVLAALVFDAEQVKTAKIKDPERPAYTFPRVYGISDQRKISLLLSKMIIHSERFLGRTVTANRKVINGAQFRVPLIKDLDRILCSLRTETFITSTSPISPLDSSVYRSQDQQLPDLFPVRETATIPRSNFYDWTDRYPVRKEYHCSHPHTILLHCAPEDVANQFETPVSDDQKESRAIMKAFTVAASRARQLYGKGVKILPHPITVQVVQTDSKWFQFGVFQLNTLDIIGGNGNQQHNLWFRKPVMNLYSECGYVLGKPTLREYNKDVLRHLANFYASS